MQEIVLKIDKQQEEALGAIRCIDGLKVALDGNFIWLRGILYTEAPDMRLRQLPVLQSFLVNEKELLFPDGLLTPVEKLPELQWKKLTEYLTVELPPSSLPGKTAKRIPLELKPSAMVKPAVGLLTSLEQWKKYAETASSIRLSPLQFAVSSREVVMILGTPLPAIPGKEYWMIYDLLIPSGYEPAIGIAARYFNSRVNPDKRFLLLFTAEGDWEQIEKSAFVTATRSGIRLSGHSGSSEMIIT